MPKIPAIPSIDDFLDDQGNKPSVTYYTFWDQLRTFVKWLSDNSSAGGAASYCSRYALTADQAVVSPAVTIRDNDLFTGIFENDNVGGHIVSFSSDFKLINSNDVDTHKGSTTVLMFTAKDGFWWPTSRFIRR